MEKTMTRRTVPWWLACLLWLSLGLAPTVQASLTIEITRGVEAALPIAVVPFGWEGGGAPPLDIAAVVEADLKRSGQFDPLPRADMLSRPVAGQAIQFRDWRILGVPHLVVGRLLPLGDGRYAVEFQLYDVFRAKALKGLRYTVQRSRLRSVAHRISDEVYEALTGIRGAFNTRIVYVVRKTGADGQSRYTLELADADAANARPILRSREPILSPAWSPDARFLAYVSFERRRPEIFLQEIATGRRERLAGFKGLNGAPSFSPDGKRLALVLSKDGNAEIYVMDLQSRKLSRITRHWAIDTEPTWAPDGASLAFVSERGGSPQIYRYFFEDGRIERLTFEGKQNLRPDFSPDGRLLTFINLDEKGRYRVAVLELETGIMRILTDTELDESPSFAPNGSMIIYATEIQGRGVLSAVSVDGRVQQRFQVEGEGDVREPSWSPFLD